MAGIILAGAVPVPTTLALHNRKGRDIPNCQPSECSLADRKASEDLRARWTAAIYRTDLLPHYNCHGLTFASRRTAIDEVSIIPELMADDGYSEVPREVVQPGDIIIYYEDGDLQHSGWVVEVKRSGSIFSPYVCSKWGKGPEVVHAWNQSPYGLDVRYFRIDK